MILAGDLGGTNTRLALFDTDPRLPVALATSPTRADLPLERLIRDFLAEHPHRVERAAFGIAGVVADGRCIETTNLPGPVDAAALAAACDLDGVVLLNDVEASAHALALLGPPDLATLNNGESDASGNRALISAGTGLGVAGLVWDGRRRHVFATEGGYADFAPRDTFEVRLRDRLAGEHVSWERVCSGGGLADIYRYIANRELEPAEITRLALDGDDGEASRALDALVSIYGAFAGNVALTLMATGGVFLGGGIAPRILPRLAAGGFMNAFLDKGLLSRVLERVPVHVIVNEQTTLIGAAQVAARTELSYGVSPVA